MPRLGQISKHLQLVRRMGRATGVDLVAAQHDGDIDQAEWSKMVTNCRGCACAEACETWLDRQALQGRAEHAPSYCENAATFTRLARVPVE